MFEQANEQYHADTSRISNSGLKEIARSPRHYYESYLDPNRLQREKTEALIIGDAVDAAILEPEKFARDYVVEPRVNKRTKAGRRAVEEYQAELGPRKTMLTRAQHKEVIRTRDAVLGNRTARLLLRDGITQHVVHWEDPMTGAACRLKFDWLRNDGILVDLKTAVDASPEGFSRAAWKYRYYVQAPFYTDGLLYGESMHIEEFIFIVVEKQDLKKGQLPSPEKVGIYHVGAEEMNIGRQRYQNDLEVYQFCLENNTWPGYGVKIQPLHLPGWAYKQRML